jgi:catechol 2,3-dioxygenase-like lactoylglutathione lyase family enzyme
MPVARFKDLCIDANDAAALGRFWAGVLGLAYVADDDGGCHLRGPTPQHTLWVNDVPEPKSVKHRVHLDVHTADLGELEALGARLLEPAGAGRSWSVLADPEGGEFCAFLRAEAPPQRLYEVGVDAADPPAIAGWWADAFGARLGAPEDQGFWWVDEIDGAPFESLVFASVPEPKTAKNRLHWDVSCPDVSALLDAGATLLRPPDQDIDWHVLADPEGNEFCAFVDPPAAPAP